MTTDKSHNGKDSREAEAQRILDRVNREAETVGTSSMARNSDWHNKRSTDLTKSEAKDQAIEDLGRKIGRSLGWIAMVILAVYLLRTYIF